MSSIMDLIGLELSELSALELVKMYMTLRSQMSSIMYLIRPEPALEFENFPYLTLFTL